MRKEGTRRELILQTGSVLALTTVAGCVGSTSELAEEPEDRASELADEARDRASELASDVREQFSTEGLTVSNVESDAGIWGGVVVSVLVVNRGDERGSAVLNARVDIEDGPAYHDSMEVSVAANGQKRFELEFELEFVEGISAFQGRYETDVWLTPDL